MGFGGAPKQVCAYLALISITLATCKVPRSSQRFTDASPTTTWVWSLCSPRFSGRSVLKITRNESSWSGPAAQDNLGSEAKE